MILPIISMPVGPEDRRPSDQELCADILCKELERLSQQIVAPLQSMRTLCDFGYITLQDQPECQDLQELARNLDSFLCTLNQVLHSRHRL